MLIVLIKTAMGLTSIFASRLAAQNAHKVPLGTFSPIATQLLLSALARAGLSTFVVALFCALVLVRYRSLIPATYVLLLIEHTGRTLLFMRESAITGTSSALIVNLVLVALTILGLVSCLF